MENRLYVGGLSNDVSVAALRARFAEYGEVVDVNLVTDRASGRVQGHAFVTMATAADAERAMTHLNGTLFEERPLRVNIAGEDRGRSKAAAPAVEQARIRTQFRERLNMVYELDCAGGIKLVIKMFPVDAREQSWRLEASITGTTATATASAPTRAAALEEIGRGWQDTHGTTPALRLDWAAIKTALAAVRAI
jgi:hypothetical protein